MSENREEIKGRINPADNAVYLDVEYDQLHRAILVCLVQTKPKHYEKGEVIWLNKPNSIAKLKKILETADFLFVYDQGNDILALDAVGIDVKKIEEKIIDVYWTIEQLTGKRMSLAKISKDLNLGNKYKHADRSSIEIQKQCQRDVSLTIKVVDAILDGRLFTLITETHSIQTTNFVEVC